MNTKPTIGLIGLLAVSQCFASDPAMTKSLESGVHAQPVASVNAPSEAAAANAAQTLQARYPARPAVFHADGSVSQYLGASQLLPDLENGLEGLNVGDEKSIDVEFPENY